MSPIHLLAAVTPGCAAGPDTPGAHPQQRDGMPGNPHGTALERALGGVGR